MHEGTVGQNPSSRLKVVLAFAAVYLIWGSTYLAIRYAIETLPAFLMAGCRFFLAGAVLYCWSLWQGVPRPKLASWKPACIAGGLLLLGGNGCLVWAEKRVPSGLAALLIATVPLWIAVLEWVRPGGSRPGRTTEIGLIFGFAGMLMLVDPSHLARAGSVDILGAALLMFGSLSWATGSLYANKARSSDSPLMGAAMQMLGGGALLVLAGLVTGEPSRFVMASLSSRSIGAFIYLVTLGSLIGFTSYIWLLRVTTASRVSTYAFVNPVVAVFLGWALAGEPVTPRTVVAAVIIIAGVVIITSTHAR